MGQIEEPQRIPDEREFLHSISNPLTTALALASKTQNLSDLKEIKATAERLTRALEQAVNMLKARREQIRNFEN